MLSAVSKETRAKRVFCSFSWCLQIKLTDLVTLLETLLECKFSRVLPELHRSKERSFLPINKYPKAFTSNAIYDLNPKKIILLLLFIYITGVCINSDQARFF